MKKFVRHLIFGFLIWTGMWALLCGVLYGLFVTEPLAELWTRWWFAYGMMTGIIGVLAGGCFILFCIVGFIVSKGHLIQYVKNQDSQEEEKEVQKKLNEDNAEKELELADKLIKYRREFMKENEQEMIKFIEEKLKGEENG